MNDKMPVILNTFHQYEEGKLLHHTNFIISIGIFLLTHKVDIIIKIITSQIYSYHNRIQICDGHINLVLHSQGCR